MGSVAGVLSFRREDSGELKQCFYNGEGIWAGEGTRPYVGWKDRQK
jgi:hypothetical protein